MTESTTSSNPFFRNERGCRCGADREGPEERLLPEEGCGWCEVCGAVGHRRNFPGLLPFRGSWCDRHYEQVYRFHPLGGAGILTWTIVGWSATLALVWLGVL